MGSTMANRKNSQLRKVYVDCTNWFSTCQNSSLPCIAENLVPGNSDFSYLRILLRGQLTIQSINLVGYVWTDFAILDYSDDVITQFDLAPHIAEERNLCHFSSDNFEQYTCIIHESSGRRFCNHAQGRSYK